MKEECLVHHISINYSSWIFTFSFLLFIFGSVIGGTLISIGFYTVMWGKAKEEKEDIETNVATSSHSKRVPLLMSYATEKQV